MGKETRDEPQRASAWEATKSLTAINTCLDEMEEFEGRDIAFVSD